MSAYAADANGNRPEVRNGTIGMHPTYDDLERENARLRRLLREAGISPEKSPASPRRAFRGWPS